MSRDARHPHQGAGKAMPVRIIVADFLGPSRTRIDFHALNKKYLLIFLAQWAGTILGFPAGTIAKALRQREAIGSTGTGDGIALPHARLAALNRPLGILVRLRQAIDFEAVDGKPVDLVFLLVLPADATDGPLTALACATRTLRQPRVRSRLRAAQSHAELYAAITSADRR